MHAHSTAFLIEGAIFNDPSIDSRNDPSLQTAQASICEKAPEVAWCIELSELNNGKILDAITIGNARALRKLYLDADTVGEAMLAETVYSIGCQFGAQVRVSEFIDLLQKPYRALVERRERTCLPEWLEKLEVKDFRDLPDKYQFNAEEAIKHQKKFLSLANQFAREYLLEFLTANPQIKTIYGLIGAAHLTFLDEKPQEFSIETTTIRAHSLTLQVSKDRTVTVHLFGGIHSNPMARQKFSEFAREQRLHLPVSEYKTNSTNSSVVWGRMAEFYCEVMDFFTRESNQFALVNLLERCMFLKIDVAIFKKLLMDCLVEDDPINALFLLQPFIIDEIRSSSLNAILQNALIEKLQKLIELLDGIEDVDDSSSNDSSHKITDIEIITSFRELLEMLYFMKSRTNWLNEKIHVEAILGRIMPRQPIDVIGSYAGLNCGQLFQPIVAQHAAADIVASRADCLTKATLS